MGAHTGMSIYLDNMVCPSLPHSSLSRNPARMRRRQLPSMPFTLTTSMAEPQSRYSVRVCDMSIKKYDSMWIYLLFNFPPARLPAWSCRCVWSRTKSQTTSCLCSRDVWSFTLEAGPVDSRTGEELVHCHIKLTLKLL